MCTVLFLFSVCCVLCFIIFFSCGFIFFFFNDTSTTEIYTYLHTLSLHDALPIYAYMPWAFTPSARIALSATSRRPARCTIAPWEPMPAVETTVRSEEHTSELQSLMRISYAVFCLKKKK